MLLWPTHKSWGYRFLSLAWLIPCFKPWSRTAMAISIIAA